MLAKNLQYLKKKKQKPLFEAVQKVKEGIPSSSAYAIFFSYTAKTDEEFLGGDRADAARVHISYDDRVSRSHSQDLCESWCHG